MARHTHRGGNGQFAVKTKSSPKAKGTPKMAKAKMTGSGSGGRCK